MATDSAGENRVTPIGSVELFEQTTFRRVAPEDAFVGTPQHASGCGHRDATGVADSLSLDMAGSGRSAMRNR